MTATHRFTVNTKRFCMILWRTLLWCAHIVTHRCEYIFEPIQRAELQISNHSHFAVSSNKTFTIHIQNYKFTAFIVLLQSFTVERLAKTAAIGIFCRQVSGERYAIVKSYGCKINVRRIAHSFRTKCGTLKPPNEIKIGNGTSWCNDSHLQPMREREIGWSARPYRILWLLWLFYDRAFIYSVNNYFS